MSDTVQTIPASRTPLTFSLVVLGVIGAASFYFSSLPIPAEYADILSPEAFRVQITITPIVMVLIAGSLHLRCFNRAA